MINEPQAYKYCRDSLTEIENYDKAIADKNRTWIIHHRGEILPCGRYSKAALQKFGIYWNRPASELIFMTRAEHQSLHAKGKTSPWKGKRLSPEHKRKIGMACKGKPAWNKGVKVPDHVKEKISNSLKGHKSTHDISGASNPMYGKHHSKETKMKLSKALKGRILWNKGSQIKVERTKDKLTFASGKTRPARKRKSNAPGGRIDTYA